MSQSATTKPASRIAAVAMVLVFAKVFTHRARKAERREQQPSQCRLRVRAVCHGLAVLGAMVAAVAALVATEDAHDRCVYHGFAWGGLAVVIAIFVIEVIVDDVWPHVRRASRKPVISSGTE